MKPDRTTAAWLVAVSGLLGAFVIGFQPAQKQWLIDGSWMFAVLLWMGGFRRRYGPVWPNVFDRTDAAILVVTVFVFSATWLPVYDDWRWAYTGDSVGFAATGYHWASGYATRSLLSAADGLDHWMTWTQSVLFNWPMVIFEPNLFWHRVGKLFVSCGVLVAVYGCFRVVVGRWWALMIVALLASNYHWLWVSHSSYEHLDSQVFAYVSVAAFVSVWRDPQRYSAWAALGVVAGLSLFFSKMAWGEVATLGLVLVILSCINRWWFGLLVYLTSGLIAGLPMLLQMRDVYQGFTFAAKANTSALPPMEYIVRIARTVLEWPVWQPIYGAGLHGPFLRWPFETTYLAGWVLAAAAVLPVIARWLRIPRAAFFLGLLLSWDAVLFAITNARYPNPSQNRVYHLLPLQMFLACLPFIVAYAWIERWRVARWAVATTAVGALVVSAAQHTQVFLSPAPRAFGINLWDGLIEMDQRVGAPVVLFSTRPHVATLLSNRGDIVNLLYQLPDKVVVEHEYTEASIRAACRKAPVLCYETIAGNVEMEQLLVAIPHQPIEVLNSIDIQCFSCAD